MQAIEINRFLFVNFHLLFYGFLRFAWKFGIFLIKMHTIQFAMDSKQKSIRISRLNNQSCNDWCQIRVAQITRLNRRISVTLLSRSTYWNVFISKSFDYPNCFIMYRMLGCFCFALLFCFRNPCCDFLNNRFIYYHKCKYLAAAAVVDVIFLLLWPVQRSLLTHSKRILL